MVEQRLGDRGVEVGVAAQGIDRRIEIGGRRTQIGPGAPEAGMAMRIELAVGLDGSRPEARSREGVDGDADAHLGHRLAPAFTGAVQVPDATEQQIGVQDQAVVPHDVELLAVALDQLDDSPRRRYRAIEVGALERQHSSANQGRS